MSFARTKSGLRQFSVWCALAGVTLLLTLLFSFLGTLTAAVVSGVMIGSARRWQWNSIPISLVFPAVILAFSHYSKIELPPGKVNLIALVCAAAFWGVCGMMFCLHFLAQKSPPNSQQVDGSAPAGPESSAPRGLSLTALRGNWTCENTDDNGSAQRKMLKIEAGQFVLTLNDLRGRPHVIARGDVTLDKSPANQPVVRLSEQRGDTGVN